MEHQQWKEWLQLSVYDELNDEEQRQLDAHVMSCRECQAELVSLKKFHQLASAYVPDAINEKAMSDARLQLRKALSNVPPRRSLKDWLGDVLENYVFPNYKIALGGIAMLVAGVILGSFLSVQKTGQQVTQTVQQESQAVPGDTRIMNVRFINSDPSSDEIEFAFEAVKPVRMKGHINDEQIQRILSHAILNEQNVGVRLASINAVSSKLATPDREIKKALITAIKSDGNAGVRTEALKVLRGYPVDQEIKDAFLFVLSHDDNPGLRITAINFLDSIKVVGATIDQNYLKVLREKMQSDDNNYIRLRAKAVIEENRQ